MGHWWEDDKGNRIIQGDWNNGIDNSLHKNIENGPLSFDFGLDMLDKMVGTSEGLDKKILALGQSTVIWDASVIIILNFNNYKLCLCVYHRHYNNV